MTRRWTQAALVAAIVLMTAGGPALALCGATLDTGCCCGTGPGMPSPCRDAGPAGDAAVCCAPSSSAAGTTQATAPTRGASVEFVALVDRFVGETRENRALPSARVDATVRRGVPPVELFTLHEAFLI